MSGSPRRRYTRSPSPRRRSRSPPRRSSTDGSSLNPGNNLYVTGLSTRVTEKQLEHHFSKEGKVIECRLVVDPRTKESRGFGFVMFEYADDAERALKYLNKSTLEGRIISIEKSTCCSAYNQPRFCSSNPASLVPMQSAPILHQ
eukprot:TRINITY_DN18331_c0_g1_i3.p1 TRINITY_DN18331_c0_g1~~TRINITY_DN18331_c0_g1_i3.p1  ORF type:complete len:144 (+),score=17.92 TRINITY_DN18331_c0_g1_i3:154-585(+)